MQVYKGENVTSASELASKARQIRVADNVHLHELDGELIVLNLTTEHYLSLNQTATIMWKSLLETGSVDETYRRMVAMFDADPELLYQDVIAFVERLISYKLIEADFGE